MQRVALLLFLSLICETGVSGAQNTSSSLVLDVPIGTRSMGMGFTGVADPSDAPNVFLNPASVAFTGGLFVHGGIGFWRGDNNQFNFGIVTADSLTQHIILAGSIYHRRAETRVLASVPPYKIAFSESWMTATAAASWGGAAWRSGVGGSFRWDTSAQGADPLFDVGWTIGRHIDRGLWRIDGFGAVSLRNGGDSTVRVDSIVVATESETRYGISIRLSRTTDTGEERVGLTINADAADSFDRSAIGTELSLYELIHLRGGYGDNMLGGAHVISAGVGVGTRFGFFYVQLDYAYARLHDESQGVNTLGTTMAFDI